MAMSPFSSRQEHQAANNSSQLNNLVCSQDEKVTCQALLRLPPEQLLKLEALVNNAVQSKGLNVEKDLQESGSPFQEYSCSSDHYVAAMRHLTPGEYYHILKELLVAPQWENLPNTEQQELLETILNRSSAIKELEVAVQLPDNSDELVFLPLRVSK